MLGFLAYVGPLFAEDVAVLETSKGRIVLEFWENEAPKTVKNFKKLAEDKFYDGTAFHRIVAGFMVQGGDPKSKDAKLENEWGTGDPGYKIQAEFNGHSHQRGVISMARSADPDSAGSQFFIVLGDASFLDGKYTAFGKLIEGEEALAAIAGTPVIMSPGGERSKPTERVELKSVSIVPRDTLK